jgi:hypothetical protein
MIMEMMCMKKIIMSVVLVATIMSCSYFEGAERSMRERGYECTYNSKGEVQVCGYIK